MSRSSYDKTDRSDCGEVGHRISTRKALIHFYLNVEYAEAKIGIPHDFPSFVLRLSFPFIRVHPFPFLLPFLHSQKNKINELVIPRKVKRRQNMRPPHRRQK